MGNIILHKDGAWNVYTTVSDGAIFTTGVREQDVRDYYRETFGERGLWGLDREMDTARTKGSNSRMGETVADCARRNTQGVKGAAWIAQYLTLPADADTWPTVPAEHFMRNLEANVDNEKLSDADFRAFVRNTLPVVKYTRQKDLDENA